MEIVCRMIDSLTSTEEGFDVFPMNLLEDPLIILSCNPVLNKLNKGQPFDVTYAWLCIRR